LNGVNHLWAWIAASGIILPCLAYGARSAEPMIFTTFADDASSISNVRLMAESIRAFGGRYKDAPIWLYMPAELVEQEAAALEDFKTVVVQIKTSETPEAAEWFFYSGKVYAAARAEAEATGRASILVWLDVDTIMLQEPVEFDLPAGKSLGYRPVMHKNVGLLFTEPPDAFWGRAFDLLAVSDTSFFPMVTPADSDTIRPYFNAGCLALRPERGLMAEWVECFTKLYSDSAMTEMCRADRMKRIFIHQVALTGAILRHLERAEMMELSDRFNYPIFFEQMFGAKHVFNDLTGVVTLRHEYYFKNPAPDWDKQLKGPTDRIKWMKEYLGGAD
jgi:hypothetical protein